MANSVTTVTVNDPLVTTLDYRLSYVKSYLESAESYVNNLYEPEEYKNALKDRITEVKDAIAEMESILENLKNVFKYYKTYTDYHGDEGTWVV